MWVPVGAVDLLLYKVVAPGDLSFLVPLPRLRWYQHGTTHWLCQGRDSVETRHIRQELIGVVDGLGSDLASRARSGQRKHVRLSSTYTVQENSTNTKESVSAKVVLIAV